MQFWHSVIDPSHLSRGEQTANMLGSFAVARRPDRKQAEKLTEPPNPRKMQTLLQAWKQLWKWR
jgi:hypothetical protein